MKKNAAGRSRRQSRRNSAILLAAQATAVSVAGMLNPGGAMGATYSWTGATDALWSDQNWNTYGTTTAGGPPGSADIAYFNNAGTGNVIINLGTGQTVGAITFDTPSAAAYTIGIGTSQSLTLASGGTIALTGSDANNQAFNSTLVLGANAAAGTYTISNSSPEALTFDGNITGGPTGGTAGTETLDVLGTGQTTISGSLLNGGASQTIALTKNGSGTLTFNGATNASVLGSGVGGGAYGAVNVNSGYLTLDFSNFTTSGNADLLNQYTNALTMAGGALQIIGNATYASSQSFVQHGVTAGAGLSTFTLLNPGGTSNTTPTLTLGTFTQNIGSETVFNGPAYYSGASTSGVTTPTANAGGTGTITTTTPGQFTNVLTTSAHLAVATVGPDNWASVSTSSGTNYILSGDQVSGFYTQVLPGGTVPNGNINVDLLGNAVFNNSKPAYVTTVRFNVPGAYTATTGAGGSGYLLVLGGILVTPNVGAYNTTLANGGEYIGASGTGNAAIDVYQNNTAGEFLLSAPLYVYGSDGTSYVQGGPGTVVLTGQTNLDGQTGSTYLDGGDTVINNDAQLGKASTGATLYLNGGAAVAASSITLDNAGSNKRPITLLGNGGGLAAYTGTTLTVDGQIGSGSLGSAAGAGPLVIGIPASAANGNTAGLLPGTGRGSATANAAQYAYGTVVLNSANNTYYGGTTITGGSTLNINSQYNLGGANQGTTTLSGGTLQYATTLATGAAGSALDISGQAVNIIGSGNTIDVNGHAVTYANSIGNGTTGNLAIASSVAGGVLTLTSGSNFTGGLTVNQNAGLITNGSNAFSSATINGTLTTNATTSLVNPASAVAVNSGGTWNALTGANTLQIGSTGASLSLAGGGTINMVDGSIGSISVNTAGGTSGTGTVLSLPSSGVASLSLEVGAAGADQIIANNGVVTGGAGTVNLSLTALGTASPSASPIPLLTIADTNAAAALLASEFSLQTHVLNFGVSGNFATSLVLEKVDGSNYYNQLDLQLTSQNLYYYWNGGNNASWATPTNFYISHAGTVTQTNAPGATDTVFETADSPAGSYTQTLDAATTINALVFTGTNTGAATNSVTINSGGSATVDTLTLDPTTTFTDPVTSQIYSAATGLVVQSGSAAHTINANVVLGDSQTWEIDNSPANALTVAGSIGDSGSGYTLTKTGLGGLTLTGSNTYSGQTIVSNGVLTAANNAALGSSSATTAGLLLNPGTGLTSTVNFTSASPAIASLASSGAGTADIVLGNTSGSGSATTLTVGGNNASTTFAGSISDGSGTTATAVGGLTKTGSGTLALTGTNTYAGATNITGGVLSVNSANSLPGALAGNTIGINNATLDSTTGTYALTANQAIGLSGTGTIEVDAGTLTVNGVVSGSSANLTKTGAGFLNLNNAANTYGGTTSINGGNVQFAASGNLGSASATNTLSFNGGTLELLAGNAVDLTANRAIALPGAGALLADAGSSITVDGNITGMGTLTVAGTGSVSLTAGTDTFSNLVIANGSTLNIAGASVSLANNTQGTPYTSYEAGGNTCAVFISSGSLTYANDGNAGNDPNGALIGSFTQTGGMVTTEESDMAGTAGQTFQLYVGGTTGASYISYPGKYASFTVGTRGTANAYVSGNASLTVNPNAGGFPLIVGAQYTQTGGDTAGTRTFVQQDSATVTTPTGLTLGSLSGTTNSSGAYYLNGGTLTTSNLKLGTDAGGYGAGTLYFGGGAFNIYDTSGGGGNTLATDAHVSTVVNSGGGTINLTNGNITWAGAITQGAIGTVTVPTIANAGSGYKTAPTVTVSAPSSGTTATATAIINAVGQVVDVVITNPGSGYTSAPTFTFSPPTSGSTATATGNAPLTGAGSLVVNGGNAAQNQLILDGANTFTGGLYIENGAEVVLGATGSTFGATTSPLAIVSTGTSGSGFSQADLAGFSTTTGPLSGNANSTIFNDGSAASTLTVNTANSTGPVTSTYAGNIGGSFNTVNLATIGNGTLVLTGGNTYSGTTTIGTSSGTATTTLVLGSGGNLTGSGVTVNSGASVFAVRGNGGIQAPVTLAGGSTLSQVDNTATGVLSITGSLAIGGTTATNLDFELDDNGHADEIEVSGSVTTTGQGGKIFLTGLTPGGIAPSSGTDYTLITGSSSGSSLGTSGFSLGSGSLTLDGKTYLASLSPSTSTDEIVQLTLVPPNASEYWTGGSHSGSWTAAGNFATDSTGQTAQTAAPAAFNTVFETANQAPGSTSVSNFTQTLDAATTINALVFLGGSTPAASNAIAIGPGSSPSNTLTLNGAISFSDGSNTYSGVGLLMEAGSAGATISANVALGNSQTWEIDSTTGSLTVSGNITDGTNGASSLTKTGVGALVLSGSNNTYSGGTTISAGTIQLGSAGALPSGTALTANGGALDLHGNSAAVSSISDGGVSTGLITDSTGSGVTLNENGSSTTSYGGTISGTGLNLTYSGSGVQTLAGTNTYTGLTSVTSGTLIAASNAALGSSTSATAGLVMSPSSGTAIVDFTSATPAIASLASSGAGTSSIVLGNTTGMASATTLTVGGGNQSTNFGGIISDLAATNAAAIGNLTKTGSGTLTLSGANTFTGTTTISNGTLLLANSAALQSSILNYNNAAGAISFGNLNAATIGGLSGSQNLALTNASANPVILTLGAQNATYNGALTGTGGITMFGNTTQSLLGANTYSGPTTIYEGSLTIGGATSISSAGNIDLTGAYGTAFGYVDTLTVQGTASISTTGGILLASDDGQNMGVTGYPGPGNLILSGSASLSAASLTIGNGTRVGSGNNVTIGGTALLSISGTYILDNTLGSTQATTNTNLNGGTLAVGSFTAPEGGSGTNQLGAINFNGGVLEALSSSTTFLPASTRITADVQAGGAIINTNGYGDTISAVITHNATSTTDGGLTKIGAGTLTLASTGNTYNGPTTVDAGSLYVNNTAGSGTGTGNVNVIGGAGGASLLGTGTISGSVSLTTATSTIEPGSGAGTGALTVHGLTGVSGSTFVADLNVTAPGLGVGSGDSAGELVIPSTGGTVTLSGMVLKLNLLSTPAGGLNSPETFVIIDNQTTETSGAEGTFASIIPASGSGSPYFTYSVNYGVENSTDTAFNDVTVTVSAVPEPTSLGLLGIGGVMMMRRRRQTRAAAK